jgi:hypothetical protein
LLLPSLIPTIEHEESTASSIGAVVRTFHQNGPSSVPRFWWPPEATNSKHQGDSSIIATPERGSWLFKAPSELADV